MKKVMLSVVLMGFVSVASANPLFMLIGQAASMAPVGVGFAHELPQADSADLFKTVTVNRKGDGYNGTMTVYEFNRSDKSVYSLVN